jgi:hypothetical protein
MQANKPWINEMQRSNKIIVSYTYFKSFKNCVIVQVNLYVESILLSKTTKVRPLKKFQHIRKMNL